MEQGLTVAQLFIDALSEDPEARRFRFDDAIQADVSSVPGLRGLDLLPSSLRLIDVQEKLAARPLGQFYSMAPSQVLETAIKRRLDDWDYILIECCPPNLGIITLNGLRISDAYLIPTIPDVLSTYGITQIIRRVQAFADEINEEIRRWESSSLNTRRTPRCTSTPTRGCAPKPKREKDPACSTR